ncbi:Bifunctional protein FolD [Chlamydiales bacterium SCGC AG-110-P3]|nr:Bifunctional protein FolD [Chlamydiales bacterium SCGC AG-110-P3]
MILDGKKLADELEHELANQVSSLALSGRPPCLAVVIVGEDPASQVYVSHKAKACKRIGIRSIMKTLPANTSQKTLIAEVERLNADPKVDGILVQLPVPEQINPDAIIEAIDPSKDIDGFHPVNAGRLLIGTGNPLVPCTPQGVHYMLQKSDIDPAGKRVVIIGRSNIVGKPMAAILMQRASGCNATVTIAHSRSKDLQSICLEADIIIACVGIANFVDSDMVKEGAVIIDVGINRVEDATRKSGYRLVGDVDFEAVKDRCSAITPVPGGVGPLTIAMLLKNTILAYQNRSAALVTNG